MRINEVAELTVKDGIAVLTVDAPPVNALSHAVRKGLADGLTAAIADPRVKAIVLHCAGRTFFAGADISEFDHPRQKPFLQDVQALIEDAPVPVVAAIHGTALGGGLELALVAHSRVAVPSARCGLPEVKLGLLAGAGGTQRLTRLLGPERALDLVTSGRMIGMAEAVSLGLIDALMDEGGLRDGAIAHARALAQERRPLRRIRDIEEKIEASRGDRSLFAAFRKANARRFKGFDAVESNIRAIEAVMTLPFAEGLLEERRLFDELAGGLQSRAQRHLFFAERLVAHVPGIDPATPITPVRRVGVIGAGTMGGGIAMSLLNAGIAVTLVDHTQAALDRGPSGIRTNYEISVKKGKIAFAEVQTRMGLLTTSLSLDDLGSADLVVEAAFEQIGVKQDIFQRLSAVTRPDAILATNTSYLDLDQIAGFASRPDRVIGMHFFSPANVMRLLEVVRGAATAPSVIATVMRLARTLGKIGVTVGNCTGFVGNRMLAVRQAQAERLVLEGAMPWDVDRVFQDFGFPMGPYQMRDLAGNDVGWDSGRSRSSSVREILNEQGRFGQKVGAGFYDYDDARRGTPSPVVEKIVLDFAAARGVERRAVADREILTRCLYPMVNEGLKILEEGKASRASDIDVVWIHGYGWPAYRGGPMFWAENEEGLAGILAELRILEANLGEAFHPATLLETVVSEGRRLDTVRTDFS